MPHAATNFLNLTLATIANRKPNPAFERTTNSVIVLCVIHRFLSAVGRPSTTRWAASRFPRILSICGNGVRLRGAIQPIPVRRLRMLRTIQCRPRSANTLSRVLHLSRRTGALLCPTSLTLCAFLWSAREMLRPGKSSCQGLIAPIRKSPSCQVAHLVCAVQSLHHVPVSFPYITTFFVDRAAQPIIARDGAKARSP